MKLLVFGSTGRTGRELVRQALEQGHEVTAFARDPAKLTLSHPSLRVARGDILDYGSVEQAVRGQDAVLSALGVNRLGRNAVLSDGVRNIIRAMEAEGVRRHTRNWMKFGRPVGDDELKFKLVRIKRPVGL